MARRSIDTLPGASAPGKGSAGDDNRAPTAEMRLFARQTFTVWFRDHAVTVPEGEIHNPELRRALVLGGDRALLEWRKVECQELQEPPAS